MRQDNSEALRRQAIIAISIMGAYKIFLVAVGLYDGNVPDIWWLHLGIGAILSLVCIGLVWRGAFAAALMTCGPDHLQFAVATPWAGSSSMLFLHALGMSSIVIGIRQFPPFLYHQLIYMPPAFVVLIAFFTEVPADTGALSPEVLRILRFATFAAVSVQVLMICNAALRGQERAAGQTRTLADQRSAFIDEMSHELRTPLAIMRTTAQAALHRERTAESYQDSLELIDRETRRMGAMVERILELSRLDHDSADFPLDTPIADAIKTIVHELRPAATSKDVTLDCQNGSVKQMINETLLRVALGNLLSNAIRHAPAGSTVAIILAENTSNSVTLSVQDQGPGIASADQEKIFRRYWRKAGDSGSDGHVGLGLPIAQRAASLMNAEITVDSELGKGATFSLRWVTDKS